MDFIVYVYICTHVNEILLWLNEVRYIDTQIDEKRGRGTKIGTEIHRARHREKDRGRDGQKKKGRGVGRTERTKIQNYISKVPVLSYNHMIRKGTLPI